jgi:hypothetical protein
MINMPYAVLALKLGYAELVALAHATLNQEYCQLALVHALGRQGWQHLYGSRFLTGWYFSGKHGYTPGLSSTLWLWHEEDIWQRSEGNRATLVLSFDKGWPRLDGHPARDLPDIVARMLKIYP